ncbi:MAG: histidine kinase dimerization/phosphoacceptor domain -containing protein [Roseovarius sp.]
MRWQHLGRRSKGLTVRLLLMLSLALVPLGTFAVMQNERARTEAQRSIDISVLSMTFASIAGELALIRGALGSADALGSTALKTADRPQDCAGDLKDFVDQAGLFRFAGFADPSGRMICSSSEPPWDFAGTDMFAAVQDGEGPVIMPEPGAGEASRAPLIIASPVEKDDETAGYVVFAMASFALDFVREYALDTNPTTTIIFDADGRLISAHPRDTDPETILPTARGLGSFAYSDRHVVRARDSGGAPRTYAIIPLLEGQLFVLGAWAPEDLPSSDAPPASSTLGFALLVWLVSLGVAYLGAHRLVIRHLRRLGRQMRQFSDGNRDNLPRMLHDAPDEISELSRDLRHLTETLSRDEVQLETALGEKTLLLREVHHRVRNNLQLIASIISIQMRQVDNSEARDLLRGLHDRVMTLATVHQSLYKLDRVTELRADTLLDDILRKMISISVLPESNIKVGTDLQPVTLDPDQSVPLALLATEAMTNALKYVEAPADGPARIDIRLTGTEAGEVCLEVTNTCAETPTPPKDVPKGGQIGLHLIRAFTSQLEAEAEEGPVETEAGPSFRVALRFSGRRTAGAGDA